MFRFGGRIPQSNIYSKSVEVAIAKVRVSGEVNPTKVAVMLSKEYGFKLRYCGYNTIQVYIYRDTFLLMSRLRWYIKFGDGESLRGRFHTKTSRDFKNFVMKTYTSHINSNFNSNSNLDYCDISEYCTDDFFTSSSDRDSPSCPKSPPPSPSEFYYISSEN